MKKLHTTPYHPQGNGQCERFNSTLCNMLGTLSDEENSDWKFYLGCMTHTYDCTKHASTTYSPYYLMFGRHPRLPIELATSGVESVVEKPHVTMEDSGNEEIPADISLPSQFLLPNLDDSSSNGEAEITDLTTEAEVHKEEEMQSVNSEASSLVDTNELLEFIDTMDLDSSKNMDQSDTVFEPEQTSKSETSPVEQTSVDPRSESQFSSFMSYH